MTAVSLNLTSGFDKVAEKKNSISILDASLAESCGEWQSAKDNMKEGIERGKVEDLVPLEDRHHLDTENPPKSSPIGLLLPLLCRR